MRVRRLSALALLYVGACVSSPASNLPYVLPPENTSPLFAISSDDAGKSLPVRNIHYQWVAPLKLQRRLGPGTLNVSVDMRGSVHGAFSPGGIAGPGRPDARSAEFTLHIDPVRGEHLWRLLDDAHLERMASQTLIVMGEGEPIEVGREVDGTVTNKVFVQGKTPSGIEPFLVEMRALANELVEHPKL